MDYIFRVNGVAENDLDIAFFSINGSENEANLRISTYLEGNNVDINSIEWVNPTLIEIFDKETGNLIYTSDYWNYCTNVYITYNKNLRKFEGQITYIHR